MFFEGVKIKLGQLKQNWSIHITEFYNNILKHTQCI